MVAAPSAVPHYVRRQSAALRAVALGLCACGAAWLALGSAALAGDDVARYFEQLRRRNLFALAETYALARLDDPKLPAERRTDYVVELSRTFAEHAAVVGPPQWDELWLKARSVLEDELQRTPPPSRAELLSSQAAFVAAAQADLMLREAELSPFDAPLQDAAQKAGADSLTALAALAERLEAALRSGTRRGEGAVPLYEVRRLLLETRLREGDVYRRRAALREAGGAERASDLVDAEQAYRNSLQGATDSRRVTSAKLGLADCARLRGDYARAGEMLSAIASAEPPPEPDQLDSLDACRIRGLLDQNRDVDAADQLLAIRQARKTLSGELWYLQLQVLLRLRKAALSKQDADLAARLQAEAELALKRVDEFVGGTWNRRCHHLWEGDQSSQRYGAELDGLARRAQAEFLAGRKAESAKTYAQAAALARQQGQPEFEFELSYICGSILLELNAAEDAAREFAQLAERHPEHARTPAAHLLSAYALGKFYDERRTQARREAYTAALEEHLQRFPQSPTAGDARFLLAQLAERRWQASQALPLYLAVPEDHPRRPDAIAGAARCYDALISRLKQQQHDWQPFHQEALARLDGLVSGFGAPSADWTPAHGEAVFRLAKLRLMSEPPEYQAAGAGLAALDKAAAARKPDAPATEWDALLRRALPVRLLALAGSGRTAAAHKLLESTSIDDRAELLAVVVGLDQLAGTIAPDQRAALPELFWGAVLRLEGQRDKLAPAERTAYSLARIHALLLIGDTPRAIGEATTLRDAFAKDAAQLRRLGELLQTFHRRESLLLARSCFVKIEGLSESGSPAWLIARLDGIRCLEAAGQRAEALKYYRVTLALYPELHDADIRARYEEVGRQLGEPAAPRAPSSSRINSSARRS